jgi:hypothetical protein
MIREGKSFTVPHLGNGKTVEFARRNKLYVADWSVTGLYVCATVKENGITNERIKYTDFIQSTGTRSND